MLWIKKREVSFILYDCSRELKLECVLTRCLRIFTGVKNQVKNIVLVLRGRSIYIDISYFRDILEVGIRVCDRIELICDHHPESLMII